MELSQLEARIIGCLLEKEITTPDQYPLSLNSLALACNQKSSREPVMALAESDVQTTIDDLIKKRLISEQSGFGSRVVKYKHRFCNTEFSELQFSPAEVALICVLLLRGPQTPGELKTRTNRLYEFTDNNQVEAALTKLSQQTPPQVAQLPREQGKRDAKYIELFSILDESTVLLTGENVQVSAITQQTINAESRIEQLELTVADLEQRLAKIESQLF